MQSGKDAAQTLTHDLPLKAEKASRLALAQGARDWVKQKLEQDAIELEDKAFKPWAGMYDEPLLPMTKEKREYFDRQNVRMYRRHHSQLSSLYTLKDEALQKLVSSNLCRELYLPLDVRTHSRLLKMPGTKFNNIFLAIFKNTQLSDLKKLRWLDFIVTQLNYFIYLPQLFEPESYRLLLGMVKKTIFTHFLLKLYIYGCQNGLELPEDIQVKLFMMMAIKDNDRGDNVLRKLSINHCLSDQHFERYVFERNWCERNGLTNLAFGSLLKMPEPTFLASATAFHGLIVRNTKRHKVYLNHVLRLNSAQKTPLLMDYLNVFLNISKNSEDVLKSYKSFIKHMSLVDFKKVQPFMLDVLKLRILHLLKEGYQLNHNAKLALPPKVKSFLSQHRKSACSLRSRDTLSIYSLFSNKPQKAEKLIEEKMVRITNRLKAYKG